MIFTTKSLIYTCGGAGIGLIFFYLFNLMKLTLVGIGVVVVLALIGFLIATFKIPDNNSNELTRKLGGEEIDKAFLRWLKFRKKGNVIYTYLKEEDEK